MMVVRTLEREKGSRRERGATMAEPDVRVRRVYDEPVPQDGARVLVDRVWPRGVTKARAELTDWCRPVAPSTALRKWYGHDPAKFEEFARRYRTELEEPEPASALLRLRGLARTGPLTLLTATKDLDLSQAAVLADLLRGPLRSAPARPST
jgi:uncharacterized protein YeaO (DUF488 family)